MEIISEEQMYEELCSQVESSQIEASQGPESKIRRKAYEIVVPHNQRTDINIEALPGDVPTSSKSQDDIVISKLNAIHERLDEVFKMLDTKVADVHGSLSKKLPELAEFQANAQVIRECKVLTDRWQQSLGRITGDLECKESVELASMLPMSSEEQIKALEAKLQSKAFADAMLGLLVRRKGTKGTVDGVLRGLFKDESVADYNLEGRAGKKALVGLTVIDLIFNIFPEKTKEEVRSSIRHFITLSHNRKYQRTFHNKRNKNSVG